ncbi:MAG: GAF domain-containing protein [Bacteroidales bacterium]|nr:GAF domain-containing protein [Bacteroidales bacterium]
MSKNIVRKIVSTVLFISSLFFIRLIFPETSGSLDENKIFIYFGGLFLSVLLLFVFTFKFQTEKIYIKKQGTAKEKEDIELTIKKDINETETKINNIISELERPRPDKKFSELILKAFAKEFYIVQGLVYVKDKDKFKVNATYAMYNSNKIHDFSEGEGISGQVAKNKKIKQISDIPEDYIKVVSGLGAGSPKSLLFIPILSGNETVAIIEVAAFDKFPDDFVQFHDKLNKLLAEKLKKTEDDK